MSKVLEQALELPLPERLELLEALWESIYSQPQDLPVPEWQKAELERRLENPSTSRPWREVKQDLLKR